MDNSKLEYGAYQAVNNCVKVKPEEKVVIITDHITKYIADELFKFSEKSHREYKSFYYGRLW